MTQASLCGVLATEFRQLATDVLRLQAPLNGGAEEATVECIGLCQRFGQVGELVESAALQDLAVALVGNVPALAGTDGAAQRIASWCSQLERCFSEPEVAAGWDELTAALSDPAWPLPLTPTEAQGITAQLRDWVEKTDIERYAGAGVTAALPAELTVTPAGEVTPEALTAFQHEGPQHATQLSRALSDLGTTDRSREALREALRLAHTLKGSSSLLGLGALTSVAHVLEEALQRLGPESPMASTDTLQTLIEAGDTIEALVECVTLGGAAPEGLSALIERLHTTVPAQAPELAGAPPTSSVQPDRHAPERVAAEAASVPPVTPTLAVSLALIDETLVRGGELNISVGRLQGWLNQALRRTEQLARQLSRVQRQVHEFETLVDRRGVQAFASGALDGAAGERSALFDPLEFDQYSALHGFSRSFAESAQDSREMTRELQDELLQMRSALAQHARLGKELSSAVLAARLVPVSTIAPRLERIVRQTARQLGRQVEFSILGRELQIDTDILSGLVEPLMHALRNAIDHGLEPPGERLAAGKPETGKIELSFRREGNGIEVTCADNGRGLDHEAIAGRARVLGLLNGHDPTPEALTELIFRPGFSTREEATLVSGRGVGLDAARSSIEKLKGSVRLESRPGHGCVLHIRLPLSLTSVHALFVQVGRGVFGLAGTAVEQVIYSDAGELVEFGQGRAFRYGGQICPLRRLADLLEIEGESHHDLAREARPVVLVRGDAGVMALSVDRALESREIVIKGLGPMLRNLRGVTGGCTLPDGRVAVMLDIRDLLRVALDSTVESRQPVAHQVTASSRRALVVDDSVSARRALGQFLGDAGYEVSMASDGLEALNLIEKEKPEVLLLDLEMPRMNGLELTAHLRADARWRDLPVIMITSRATQKHREQTLRAGVTEYLFKPFSEQILLDRLLALAPP